MEYIKEDKAVSDEDCLYIIQLWSTLINMQFVNEKKRIRQALSNHFCFILNRTFLFRNKIHKVQNLILLLKLVGLLIKVSWVSKSFI